MSDSSPGSGDVFDLDRLRQLVELMKEHDLAQLNLRQGEQRIQLQRGGMVGEHEVLAPSATVGRAADSQSSRPAASSRPQDDDGNIVFIKSPMVGTFYAKSSPEAETFVKVGDLVTPETTVCIIEAMKVFNEIPSEVSGRIVALLIDNEEPVEYGKPLFKVDTGG